MSRREPVVFLVLLAVILLGVFWKTFGYDLVWDDRDYLGPDSAFFRENTLGSALGQGYFVNPESSRAVYWRPVVIASFWAERSLWGLHGWSLRLANVLIYWLALAVLYAFLKRQREKPYVAEMVVLLFALNPLNVDNIVWVVGRCDLLLLLFGLAALALLARAREEGRRGLLALSTAAYALALLSKESALLFLPVLFLYDAVRTKKPVWPYHAANVAVTAGFFLAKSALLGLRNPALVFAPSLGENVLTLVRAAGYYLRSLLFPVSFNRFLPNAELARPVFTVFGALFLAAILALALRARRDPELLVPGSLVAVFAAGHLGFVFSDMIAFNLYARYMMIPALGLLWLLARLLGRLPERPRLGAAFLLLVVFIPAVVLHAMDYRNEAEFFGKAIKAFPRNGYLAYQMAVLSLRKENYLDEELFLKRAAAARLKPDLAIGTSLLNAGLEFRRADYEKAEAWLASLDGFPARLFTPFARCQLRHQRALIALFRGRDAEAERLFGEALDACPDRRDTYEELLRFYWGRERWAEAAALERRMTDRFGLAFQAFTDRARADLEAGDEGRRADLYAAHRNFGRAASILEGLPSRTPDQRIAWAVDLYRLGRAAEGKAILDGLAVEAASDRETLNKLGLLLLRDFVRQGEAVEYFKRSLEADKDQPQIFLLVCRLTEDFLQASPPRPPETK